MVRLLVKRGDEPQFLFETSTSETVDETIAVIAAIFNGRLKVKRLSAEMAELREHGILLPPEMIGLTPDQVEDLKLVDGQADVCMPSGGYEFCADPIGRRNGRAPKENMKEVLRKTMAEAEAIIDKNQVMAGVCLTEKMVAEALSLLKGAVMIVYPMGLPPYDPVRMELENREELDGTQASQQVIDPALAQLWFSGKELLRGKTLADFVGKNEKTKVVVKLQKKGQGAPGREPLMTEDEQKKLMAAEFRRQEELKRRQCRLCTVRRRRSDGVSPSAEGRGLRGLLRAQTRGRGAVRCRAAPGRGILAGHRWTRLGRRCRREVDGRRA